MTWIADAYKTTDPLASDIGLVVRPIMGTGSIPLPVAIVSGGLTFSGSLQLSASSDPTRPGTVTVFPVTASQSSCVLLYANADRRQASFFNNGETLFYLKWGDACSSSSFTTIVWPQALYELPYPPPTCPITAVWASGSSPAMNCMVTEATP